MAEEEMLLLMAYALGWVWASFYILLFEYNVYR